MGVTDVTYALHRRMPIGAPAASGSALAMSPPGSAEMVAAATDINFAQPGSRHIHEQLDTIAGRLGASAQTAR